MGMDISSWMEEVEDKLKIAKKYCLMHNYILCCSTCYQVAEEALKAALRYPGCPIVGHSLMALLKEITKFAEVPKEVESSCLALNKYYVISRYPDAVPSGTIEVKGEEAREALKHTERVVNFVKGIMSAARRVNL